MPVPTSINDLSTTAGSNSPPGTEAPTLTDDYLRVHASYIATLRDRTSIGTDPGDTGFWPDITATTQIHKTRDRLFVGDGCEVVGNYSGAQGGVASTSAIGANWALRDSQFLSVAATGLIAVTGFSRSSDQTSAPTEAIGVGGFVIHNKAGSGGWGLYSDVQREAGAGSGFGLECALKNKGSDISYNAYGPVSGSGGMLGVHLVAGGDSSYGGTATAPVSIGLNFGYGSTTFNTGIRFAENSLTGSNGYTGTATAVSMAKGHALVWQASLTNLGATIRSDVSNVASNDVAMIFSNNTIRLNGTASTKILELAHTTSAVNYAYITNNSTGGAVSIRALGGDTDVDLFLTGSGSSGVALRDGGGTPRVRVNTTGVGFNNVSPLARPTLNAACSDLATAIALLNQIRTALVNNGLAQ